MNSMIRHIAFLIISCLYSIFASNLCSAQFEEKNKHCITEDVKLIATFDDGLILELNLPQFDLVEEVKPEGLFQRIRIPNWINNHISGEPELPVRGKLIQVPEQGRIQLKILEKETKDLYAKMILPNPRWMSDLLGTGKTYKEFEKNKKVYSTSEFYPKTNVLIEPRVKLRDVSVARVLFTPFQWNPVTGDLHITKKIRISVTFETPLPPEKRTTDRKSQANLLSNISKARYENALKRLVCNYKRRDLSHSTLKLNDNTITSVMKGFRNAPIGLRMEIIEDGIYKITHTDLINVGINPSTIDPKTFKVFHNGNELAIQVKTKNPLAMSPGDHIEFYAQAFSNLITDTNVYWLFWDGAQGQRMSTQNGNLTPQGVYQSSFTDTLHFEENHSIWEGIPTGLSEDYWFWVKITAPYTANYDIHSHYPVPDQTTAKLKVYFHGRSTASPHPNHHTKVSLNGQVIGDALWDNDVIFIQDMTIPINLIKHGKNVVTINAPGDTGAVIDIFYLNWIELQYEREFIATNDELAFTLNGNNRAQVEVKRIRNPNIRIYDTTDPYQVKRIINYTINVDEKMDTAGSGPGPIPPGPPATKNTAIEADYCPIFETDLTGEQSFYVISKNAVKTPHKMTLWNSTDLENTANGADFIIITGNDFLPSIAPLVTLRQSQGWRVVSTGIDDVYNEFNHGIVDPSAIKNFLEYAYHHWTKPAPTHVLLLGDANTDYKDFLNLGKKSIIPTKLCVTSFGITPSDNWYGCVSGSDKLPDMFMGRLPSKDIQMATDLITKILDYDAVTGYTPDHVLMVADDEVVFENISDAVAAYVPASFTTDKVYARLYPNISAATQDIISYINAGTLITNYIGHGFIDTWSGGLFNPSKINSLTNMDRLIFCLTFTCFNGYYSHPVMYCLAERFLIAKNKGAIACFSPSGLGYNWEHEILNKEAFSLIFNSGVKNFGNITTQAKLSAYSKGATQELVDIFTLIGDPSADLK